MAIENPKYDVAISFLSKDEPTAAAIYQMLTEGLQVFFYPRRQEELGGSDGLESMRKPFFDDSRLVVILYREPWGKTPWTRVEETAIKEFRSKSTLGTVSPSSPKTSAFKQVASPQPLHKEESITFFK